MKVKAYNIAYDTEGEEIDLPTELTLTIEDNLTDNEIVDEIADKISDKTGFCIFGFNWNEIKE